MTTTRFSSQSSRTRSGAGVSALAGAAAISLAIYQVAVPGSPSAQFDTPLDWLREVLFLAYLLASIVALQVAIRDHLAGRMPARLVQAGYTLIAVGAAAGMALSEDPDWFFLLAGPGLLLSTVGFVTFAVGAYRRRALPLWAAVLAGVGGALAIIMSELGTGVLIGAFWLYVASRGRQD
jgi:hypothetical protein